MAKTNTQQQQQQQQKCLVHYQDKVRHLTDRQVECHHKRMELETQFHQLKHRHEKLQLLLNFLTDSKEDRTCPNCPLLEDDVDTQMLLSSIANPSLVSFLKKYILCDDFMQFLLMIEEDVEHVQAETATGHDNNNNVGKGNLMDRYKPIVMEYCRMMVEYL